MAAALPEEAPRFAGMERADSLAFDLHKWGYLPYEIACVLVKDRAAHEGAFTLTPSYLTDEGRGVIAERIRELARKADVVVENFAGGVMSPHASAKRQRLCGVFTSVRAGVGMFKRKQGCARVTARRCRRRA